MAIRGGLTKSVPAKRSAGEATSGRWNAPKAELPWETTQDYTPNFRHRRGHLGGGPWSRPSPRLGLWCCPSWLYSAGCGPGVRAQAVQTEHRRVAACHGFSVISAGSRQWSQNCKPLLANHPTCGVIKKNLPLKRIEGYPANISPEENRLAFAYFVKI